MSLEQFANNAAATLGSAVSPTTTIITVTNGSLFPAISGGQWFSATLLAAGNTTGTPNEIVYVTARNGDSFTVVRGQEGTTAQAWNVGDSITNEPTAAYYNNTPALTDIAAQIQALVPPMIQTDVPTIIQADVPPMIQQQAGNYAQDTGSANAGVITLAPTPASLTALVGAPIRIRKTNATNSGAYTLNVNGLGAVPVSSQGGPLAAGQLLSNLIYECVYDGVNFELISTPQAIINGALAPMAAMTVKANITSTSATPSDVPIPTLAGMLGTITTTLGTNGYLTIPVNTASGQQNLIIQWGTASGGGTYSYPIPFPNSVFAAYATPFQQGQYNDAAFVNIPNNSQIYVETKGSQTGNISGYGCYWLAIGY